MTNVDDKNGLVMTQNTRAKVYTYSLRGLADFKGRILEHYFDGMLLEINNIEVFAQFIGRFNASNLLAVYGAACLLGKRPEEVLTVLSTLRPVNGRFDALHSSKGYTAIVDYAHTPDGLENVLSSVKGYCKGRLIAVFGCGGDRDPVKRPIMGRIGVEIADYAIITSDNPRTEEPGKIIQDILKGVDSAKNNYEVIENRPKAIQHAMDIAKKNDIIILAGKGHETYQEICGVKHHLDEREIVAAYLEETRNG